MFRYLTVSGPAYAALTPEPRKSKERVYKLFIKRSNTYNGYRTTIIERNCVLVADNGVNYRLPFDHPRHVKRKAICIKLEETYVC